jgi:hypothetical protein
MLKRFMMIGLLGISLVVILAAEANAQIDGWGWFGFSSIHGQITTIHTPPPQTKPSAIDVKVTATIQIACLNPASNGVFNGVAFKRPLTSLTPLSQGNITDRTSGTAMTDVFIDLSQFEVSDNCPNPGWTAIIDSAMALDFSGTVRWCLIDTTTGLLDCSSKKGSLDSKTVSCTLDPTLSINGVLVNQRNPDGTAPHTAVFTCPQPQ